MSNTTTDSPKPLDVADWDSSLQFIIEDMNGLPLNVHKLMAHNPTLLAAWWNFRNYSVNGGTLGARLGELVILRVGVSLNAWYEWASHVDRSLKCGLSLDEINSVLSKEIGAHWAADEASLLQAVDELLESQQISSATLAKLSSHFSNAQVMDIMAIHGMYIILGCMIKTWGLTLDPAVLERIQNKASPEQFASAAATFSR